MQQINSTCIVCGHTYDMHKHAHFLNMLEEVETVFVNASVCYHHYAAKGNGHKHHSDLYKCKEPMYGSNNSLPGTLNT